MSGWLLDTNVISELSRPRLSARVRRFIAGQRLEDLFVSTVTLAEIRFGIEAVGDPTRRAELSDWLIAATALQHGQTVVTRDTGDYKLTRVPDLNPWVADS
ncbi:PIN domain-containing protein [Variovorax sp. PBS-H4]|uniref:PIN domain-containing protein n=1 Tax=Variovorax sp. PBS-H4 TaxID=434008 RepID=UPI0013A5987F|nr:PIN domain-containing protein [Variovorax sp. PBS-H4]